MTGSLSHFYLPCPLEASAIVKKGIKKETYTPRQLRACGVWLRAASSHQPSAHDKSRYLAAVRTQHDESLPDAAAVMLSLAGCSSSVALKQSRQRNGPGEQVAWLEIMHATLGPGCSGLASRLGVGGDRPGQLHCFCRLLRRKGRRTSARSTKSTTSEQWGLVGRRLCASASQPSSKVCADPLCFDRRDLRQGSVWLDDCVMDFESILNASLCENSMCIHQVLQGMSKSRPSSIFYAILLWNFLRVSSQTSRLMLKPATSIHQHDYVHHIHHDLKVRCPHAKDGLNVPIH